LAKVWLELKSKDKVSDNYLDDLVKVENAGYMVEYVWRYFRSPYWTAPANLHEDQFTSWAVQNMPNHVCVTLVDVYSPEDKHKSADPRQQQELLNKATEELRSNRIKKAEALLEQVVQGMPAGWKAFTESDDTLLYAFWDEGEFDRCAKENPDKTVLAVFPSYSRALYLLGYINVEKGDAEGALKRLDQALSLQPDHPVILLEKATILSKIGRFQEAYEGFITAEKPHFALTPSLVARSLRGQGIALIDLDRLDDAEACLGKSLKYDPESKVAVNELEYIQKLRTGQARPGAEKIYKRK
jgi:tetratricopeptide (TPR) repeat protein